MNIINWVLFLSLFWFFCIFMLWLWKSSLLKKTWQEPYFSDAPVLIESDDWGPGGDFHAARLNKLLSALTQHRDCVNRPAILTADIVLSVPDMQKINAENNGHYFRTKLDSFPKIHQAMQAGIQQGTFVPQLHGLEHLNGNAFAQLCQNQDPRTAKAQTSENWWDWESLDSPLQGHYVDGGTLPTKPITKSEAETIVSTAARLFEQIFFYPSISTVAPCYLWNDDIEQEWKKQNIQIIQTAGYRCTGRNETGKYFQNPPIIRVGDKNKFGQIYLVRNVMYEPVDGKNTPESSYLEALAAFRQALPISISTHRYNFTRSEQEFEHSLTGLNELLGNISKKIPNIRFLSSPELGNAITSPKQVLTNHFNQSTWASINFLNKSEKLGPFLYRLYYRHPKLVLASYLTGLIIPAWIICKVKTPKIQG